MNTYTRMLRRLRPYLPRVVVSVCLTFLFAVVSSLSILMVMPTFKALFNQGGGGKQDSPTDMLGSMQTFGLKARADQIYAHFEGWLTQGEPVQALQRVVIALVIVMFLRTILQYLATLLTDWIGLRLVKDLRDDVFAKFLDLPLGFYHRYRAGELISRATNDVQIANKTINVSFTNLIRDPAQIIGFLLICLWISWKLTVLALLVLPLTMVVIVTVGKHLRRYSHRQQERMADLTSVLQETVYGIRVVKAFAMEKFEKDRYMRESGRLFTQMFKISRMQRASSPLSELLTTIVGAIILWYGGRQVFLEQNLAPEAFLTFLGALFSMIHPIKELSGVNNGIQEGMAAADRLFEIIDTPGETESGPQAPDLGTIKGRVEMREVSFEYLPGEPVLRNIDLVVEPGEVVALVGSSGAGKSTLVDLIPRFYDPQHGQVLIDGQDLRGVSLPSLRRNLGIVTQEVILFNDTVHSNIAYGLQDVSQERLEAAARAANAHEFIANLPEGYDTVIGDRGTRLSGGQRQRLSIARAILKNPAVLILDEATSALDTESEQMVQEAIDRLVQDRTTIVIAHRLSTIRSADCIYTLKDGRIVEAGSHDQLLAAGGVYADLYNLQFRNQERGA